METSYVFAGLAVTSRDEAAAWYERLLGRPPDGLPNDLEATWQLTPTASLYLVAGTGQPGRGQILLIVADLDARMAEIRARGIEPGAIEQVGEAGRKCACADPDGNVVALAQLATGST